MNAIALDDEPAALEIIGRYAEKIPFINLKKTFLSTTMALEYIFKEQVDVLFIDIQMPDMLGTDFVRLIQNRNIIVIFTTAYSEYAIESFGLRALDYLLKPIDFSRFVQSCNRAFERYSEKQGGTSSIFVKDGYDWVRVNLEEVLYIQSDTNLLFIYEKNRKISTRMTMYEILEILPADKFIRVHKSYIVSQKEIQKIERHQLTIGSTVVPLAGTYKELVENRLLNKS